VVEGWVPWEKNRIWIWEASHFTRAKRVAYAIVDVVTRYWIGYLLSTEQTTTQFGSVRRALPCEVLHDRAISASPPGSLQLEPFAR
jgi:hypothetical protein